MDCVGRPQPLCGLPDLPGHVSPSRARRWAWTAPTAPRGCIAQSVFDALGATTYVMGDEPDGFNINHGVGSTHIDALQPLRGGRTGWTWASPMTATPTAASAWTKRALSSTGDHILYVCGRHMKELWRAARTTPLSPPSCPTSACTSAFDRAGHPLRQDRRGRQVRLRVHDARTAASPGRRAVRPHHLLQIRLHRRRHSHQPEADGGHAGAQDSP